MSKKIVYTSVVGCLLLCNPMEANADFEQNDLSLNAYEQVISNEQMASLYLSCANANLISQNYKASLDDYQRTLDILGGEIESGTEFLILFGMAVAHDNLNLAGKCNLNISKIRELMNEGDSESAADDFEEGIFSEGDIINYLKTVASMSSSEKVRNALLFFVSEIFHSDSAQCSFQGIQRSKLVFSKQHSIQTCKSIWKKLEKLSRNIYRACDKMLDLLKKALDVHDRIQGEPKNKNYV